jgi:hypothetical protein
MDSEEVTGTTYEDLLGCLPLRVSGIYFRFALQIPIILEFLDS